MSFIIDEKNATYHDLNVVYIVLTIANAMCLSQSMR